MKATCPVCNNEIDNKDIESHVNSHFDHDSPRERKKVKRETNSNDSFFISTSPPFNSTLPSSSFPSFTPSVSSNPSTSTTKKEIKCHNCGENVPSWDWTRHASVHDDEAIAV